MSRLNSGLIEKAETKADRKAADFTERQILREVKTHGAEISKRMAFIVLCCWVWLILTSVSFVSGCAALLWMVFS